MNLGTFGKLSIIHGVLALLLIIELGLTGYLAGEARGWSSSINFMLFNSIWSILILVYIAIVPVVIPKLHHTIVSLGLLAVTSLFWFAGSIALAVRVAGCDGGHYCSTAKAAVAFGFFVWATFTGLTVLEGMGYMRSRGGGATADVRSKTRGYNGA